MQTWTWQENAERLKLNAKTMSDVFNTETTVYVAIRIKKTKNGRYYWYRWHVCKKKL